MSDWNVTEEDKVFIKLKFGEPNNSVNFYRSLPDEFLLEYKYTHIDPQDKRSYWSGGKGWLRPDIFNQDELYWQLNDYFKRNG